MLLSFRPPLMFGNRLGEILFTGNLQLHWTMLFGLLLGRFSLAAKRESRHGRSSGTIAAVRPPSRGGLSAL